MYKCKFCDKEFEKWQSAGAHSVLCSKNPERNKTIQKISKANTIRNEYSFICKRCGKKYKLFLTENSFKKGKYRKHCSPVCAHQRDSKRKICIYCNKNPIGKNAVKFCSKECMLNFWHDYHIRKWKSGKLSGNRGDGISGYVRRYIFEKYGNQCMQCGWSELNKHTNKIPLHVHHIDGNYKNTVEGNLILLCPNCHSLTKNYGGCNKGCGRIYRQEWRKRRRSV